MGVLAYAFCNLARVSAVDCRPADGADFVGFALAVVFLVAGAFFAVAFLVAGDFFVVVFLVVFAMIFLLNVLCKFPYGNFFLSIPLLPIA